MGDFIDLELFHYSLNEATLLYFQDTGVRVQLQCLATINLIVT